MKLFRYLLIPALFFAVLSFSGCNEQPTTTEPAVTNMQSLSKLTLPAGAVITGATFNIFVEDATNNGHDVHQVNVDWAELVETWNIFYGKTAPQYDPTVLGSFVSVFGWHSVDITALVQGWYDGSIPNYGVLINQPISADGFSTLRSREYSGTPSAPYLKVYYTVGGVPDSVEEAAFGDTYIWSLYPDDNFGSEEYLRVARIVGANYIKQALVKFDIDQEVQMGCETAYAKGDLGANTHCISEFPGVTNWGWTNYIADVSSDFSYDWPIYAGAGQCDVSKGTLVGTLHVDYNATTDELTVEYDITGPCILDETHLWVSEDSPLPIKKQNPLTYTSAPGQFNYNGQNPVTVYNLDEPFWIAAHSVVCCPEN